MRLRRSGAVLHFLEPRPTPIIPSAWRACRSLGTTPNQRAEVFPSQLEDAKSSALLASLRTSPRIPQTLTEKIVQRYSVGLPERKKVKAGDYVTLAPHKCMTHGITRMINLAKKRTESQLDNSWPVALKFMSIGASKIYDAKQIVMTLDHDVQNKSESNLKKYRQIEQFAKTQSVDFYPAGRGIGHQIMVEEGYAWPGTLAVASDSHSNMYGGLGCLGTAVVRTDAASIWATGRTWWQIPPIAKVTFTGSLPQGVTGKDVIVALCGLFNHDEVLNHAIEFVGSEETMRSLPVDARLTIANMTTEFGALSGLFPIDGVLQQWLRYKATEAAIYQASELTDATTSERFSHSRIDKLFAEPVTPDRGAKYAKYLYLNLSTLCPYVSGPNSVKVATPLDDLASQDIKINKGYLVSCTNSRSSDLAAAAKVFKDASNYNNGHPVKIAPDVDLYISAASLPEQQMAEGSGDWQALLDAGAKALLPGCGPCIGLGTGLLEPGEIGISASNRNFKGRMGSTEAQAYLASPEVVAASVLHGKITGPGWYKKPDGWSGVSIGEGDGVREEDRMITAEEALEKITGQLDSMIKKAESRFTSEEATTMNDESDQLVRILDGFPEIVEGEIIFCDADNINTDGIYPGKYTYQDDVTEEKMAEVCMSNYDSAFSDIARPGDILVSGFNFGCGSSREQAATAILAKKIPLVVAGSFGNTFSRNSINNALMGVEIPQLVRRLRETFSNPQVGAPNQSIVEPQCNQDSLDSPPPAQQGSPHQEEMLTRRTGWTFTWDVRRSKVTVQEGPNGKIWSQKVGELPPNVQAIIARGGLEKWVGKEISRKA